MSYNLRDDIIGPDLVFRKDLYNNIYWTEHDIEEERERTKEYNLKLAEKRRTFPNIDTRSFIRCFFFTLKRHKKLAGTYNQRKYAKTYRILLLRYERGLNFCKIAKIVGLSRTTCAHRFNRIIRNIQGRERNKFSEWHYCVPRENLKLKHCAHQKRFIKRRLGQYICSRCEMVMQKETLQITTFKPITILSLESFPPYSPKENK